MAIHPIPGRVFVQQDHGDSKSTIHDVKDPSPQYELLHFDLDRARFRLICPIPLNTPLEYEELLVSIQHLYPLNLLL